LEVTESWLTDLVEGELKPSNEASELMGGVGGRADLAMIALL
jgi:hypothetical protein